MIEENRQKTIEKFLKRWPLEAVKEMPIEEYTALNNKDTFCQWVETKTKSLGSINGVNSYKFGIYRTRKEKPPRADFIIKNNYCWSPKVNPSKNKTFIKVKEAICAVIEASQVCDLETIDKIPLHPYFKWKIAALYSRGTIPPIFNFQVLRSLAKAFEIKYIYGKSANILAQIMASTPPNKCQFRHAFDLFHAFYLNPKSSKEEKLRNEKKQFRKFKKDGYTANQKHSEIQNKLRAELKKKYPKERIEHEENNVDMIRENDHEFILYEVKSSPSPIYCIREALGQVLDYAFRCQSHKEKKIVVVGSTLASETDQKFINYIRNEMTVPFEYMSVELN